MEIRSRRAETLASSMRVEWRCFERRVMEGKVVVVTLGRGPLERVSICVLWSYGARERERGLKHEKSTM